MQKTAFRTVLTCMIIAQHILDKRVCAKSKNLTILIISMYLHVYTLILGTIESLSICISEVYLTRLLNVDFTVMGMDGYRLKCNLGTIRALIGPC